MYIITISNVNTGEYFFTTNHCQPHDLGPEWVSCSYRIPGIVAPRECLPDGIIRTKEDYVKIFGKTIDGTPGIEIPNPDPNYQA